jgi:CubicO group peptidase (beta-lactamase class C family)
MRLITGVLFVYLASIVSPGAAQTSSSASKTAAANSPTAGALDELILSEMRKRYIPGLSIAIIENGKIVNAKGYGSTENGGQTPVTAATLFQAGSISKPVSAMGALMLVEEGKLDLDADVNDKLVTWKVPENEFTRKKTVTLRALLSHTAGLTVHGFPGYGTDQPRPTIVQILDGIKPANTNAIRVDILPGSQWRYSGGGYTIMQQLVIDVSGKPFPQFMQEAVLRPLSMNESTFEQPLTGLEAKLTATGHLADRRPVKGKWHIYPEMAAAGLWTTPSDLARFAIGVQEALAGQSAKTLSRAMTRQMLTEQKNAYGLGLGLEGSGLGQRFGHGGRDHGFDARLVAYAKSGNGAVIMINTNDNSPMISRILEGIAREYHWPDYPTFRQEKRPAANVAAKTLDSYAGRYEFANNQMLTLIAEHGRLLTLVDGFPDEEFLPESDVLFHSAQRDVQITFRTNSALEARGFLWKENGRERKVPRIGPLFHSLKPQSDPDPGKTERIVMALRALGKVGTALTESHLLTPGARADLGTGTAQTPLADLKSLVFLTEQDVTAQQIERHKGTVSRVLHYRIVTDKPDQYLLVHMTADGLITDFDIVDD